MGFLMKYRSILFLVFFQLFFFHHVQSFEKNLSICAIFKNEASILKEWIEFHLMQGVEHFYLYNNRSSDNFREVLKPYIESNQVTLIDWLYHYKPAKTPQEVPEWITIQVGSYNDCLKKFGEKNKWIAFLDTDEFLFCPDKTKLPDYLSHFKDFAGIGVNWLIFGTSFIERLSEGSLYTKNFIYCSDGLHFRDFTYKSIVQPNLVNKCIDAHTFLPKNGFNIVDCHKEKIKNPVRHTAKDIDNIRINHYWTRDENFFQKKIVNRIERRSFNKPELFIEWASHLNNKIDLEIQKFVPELEKRLNK